MRVTVNLDPDLYSFASAYAGARGITLSAAIRKLIRRAEQMPEPVAPYRLKRTERGYLVISGGNPLTSEMVKQLSEDSLVDLG